MYHAFGACSTRSPLFTILFIIVQIYGAEAATCGAHATLENLPTLRANSNQTVEQWVPALNGHELDDVGIGFTLRRWRSGEPHDQAETFDGHASHEPSKQAGYTDACFGEFDDLVGIPDLVVTRSVGCE